jgi:hypothetical protein
MPPMKKPLTLAALSALAFFAPHSARAQATDAWSFQAAIYAYFPTISGTSIFPPSGGTPIVSVDIDSILDLKFTFMGSFEVRRGVWGGYTDLIYLDVGGSKTNTQSLALGGVIPGAATANVDLDLKGSLWTLAGTYRGTNTPQLTADALFGVRRLDITPKVRWQFGGNVGQIPLADRAGEREADVTNWDAIIGVKGRAAFGDGNRWFVPYYLDLGTGESRLTWQVMAGIGYSFGSVDLLGAWRYIKYDIKSGEALQDLTLNGPGVAVVFRW